MPCRLSVWLRMSSILVIAFGETSKFARSSGTSATTSRSSKALVQEVTEPGAAIGRNGSRTARNPERAAERHKQRRIRIGSVAEGL